MSDDDPIKTAKSTPLNTDIVELLQELENGDGVVWDERTEPVTVTEEYGELHGNELGLEGPRGATYRLQCIPLAVGAQLYRQVGDECRHEKNIGELRLVERADHDDEFDPDEYGDSVPAEPAADGGAGDA